jgi:hypothetical protein
MTANVQYRVFANRARSFAEWYLKSNAKSFPPYLTPCSCFPPFLMKSFLGISRPPLSPFLLKVAPASPSLIEFLRSPRRLPTRSLRCLRLTRGIIG